MDDAPNYTEVSRSQLDGRRSEYTRALLSEIRLIVRTIANDPLKRLSDLKVNYRFANEKAIREVTAPEIIEMISHVEAIADKQVGIDHIGFLQLVRDALVSMTTPATGLTISYTALVAGDQRSEATELRFALAKQAYDMLLDRAIWHRRLAWILTIIAILFTLFAAWEATKAALGKNLLQNLDLLRNQQAIIAAERLKLETSLDKPADEAALRDQLNRGIIPWSLIPLCNRYQARLASLPEGIKPGKELDLAAVRLETSPAERELCGRDVIVASNIQIAHFDLIRYQQSWPDLVGGVVAMFGEVLGRTGFFSTASRSVSCVVAQLPALAGSSSGAAGPDETQKKAAEGKSSAGSSCDDVEFAIAPMLQVTTNYVLPIIFGFVGSLLYVLLDHSTKLRSNTLSPRDFPLMMLRLILGLVVAACVSLLISSNASPTSSMQASGVPAAGTLVASLTLSASGITFLAGFGAEAVVLLLQSLVTRLFTSTK